MIASGLTQTVEQLLLHPRFLCSCCSLSICSRTPYICMFDIMAEYTCEHCYVLEFMRWNPMNYQKN